MVFVAGNRLLLSWLSCTVIISNQIQLGLHIQEICSEIVQCLTATMSPDNQEQRTITFHNLQLLMAL